MHFHQNSSILRKYLRKGICRDIAQPGLARLTGGQKVESSNLSIPTIFFALIPRQKNMKPEKASLHGTQCRFIRRSRASCTAGALHGTQCRFIRRQACFIKTPFQTCPAVALAKVDEAAPFYSAMKHCSIIIPQYEALRLRSV